MKLIARAIVLALAAMGAKSLYDRYAPRVREARRTGDRLMEESVRPAVHEAATTLGDAAEHAAATLGDAAEHAAATLTDASREVVGAVRDQAHPAASEGATSTGPFGEPAHGQDHPLSPMAAEELGVELSQ